MFSYLYLKNLSIYLHVDTVIWWLTLALTLFILLFHDLGQLYVNHMILICSYQAWLTLTDHNWFADTKAVLSPMINNDN